jgi:hypothetical protein
MNGYRIAVTANCPKALRFGFVQNEFLGTQKGGARCLSNPSEETSMGRGILLWLLGVPIPVIIVLLLLFHH